MEGIYNLYSDDFKEIIPFDQLQEVALYFNKNVKSYTRKWSTKYEGLYHDIWIDEQHEISLSVKYDQDGMIHHFYIQPNKHFSKPRYTRHMYQMPVDFVWNVKSGGPHEFLNEHYLEESLRYSYELNIVKDGKAYQEDGTENKHYYAYGEVIVAPANGKVVYIENGVSENELFFSNKVQPMGNYIILDHGHHEFSLVGHLKQNTMKVKVGDMVRALQPIAQCGNSGNCMQPQLIFQVMDQPIVEKCTSLRINFVNGMEPIQGDIIHPFIKK